MLLIRLGATVIIAHFIGKLVSKAKLPAILGWLITGMFMGPYALSLMNSSILENAWYQLLINALECVVGLLIGTELVWKKIKKSGRQIIVITLTQSLGTFAVVSLVFGILFYAMNLTLYLAFVFGGIALATAPAPALSVVREFRTKGPVTDMLVPMAALDDIVAVVVFFSTISILASSLSAQKLPTYMIALVVLLPIFIGLVLGLLAGVLLKKKRGQISTLLMTLSLMLLATAVGIWVNTLLPRPVLNFMIIGMGFSATFANMISEERLEEILSTMNPVLGLSMLMVIVKLGAGLDYRLILGAGLFMLVYILARAFGKYTGVVFGATISKAPPQIKKYLGFTLLPHSGVSLVFTGIAVNVISPSDPSSAQIIQGAIAAAAVINEIIAVILAKKSFEWAGELGANTEV